MEQITALIQQNTLAWISTAVIIITSVIQIAPIKINPWSKVFGWIGNQLNKDIYKKLDDMDESINRIKDNSDKREIKRLRREILAFAHELMSTDIKHTKDQFEAIIDANDDYHALLSVYDMTNGVLDREIQYILEVYDDCIRRNDFL